MKLQDLATDVEMEDEMEDGIENDFADKVEIQEPLPEKMINQKTLL